MRVRLQLSVNFRCLVSFVLQPGLATGQVRLSVSKN